MRRAVLFALLCGCTGGDDAVADGSPPGPDGAASDDAGADAAGDGDGADVIDGAQAGGDAFVGTGLLWSHVLDGLADATPVDLAVAPDGRVVVTGNYRGPVVGFGGGLQESLGGDEGIFVSTYDPDGTPGWARLFPTRDRLEAFGVATDATGRIFVTGYFETQVHFDGQTLVGVERAGDAFLVALDGSGGVLWARTLEGDGGAIYTEVAVDATGGIVVAGWYDGSMEFAGVPSVSEGEGFLARYTSAAAEDWLRPLGSATVQSLDAGETVAIAGYFYGTADLGDGPISSLGDSDAFFARFGLDGAAAGSVPIRAEGRQGASAVSLDPETGDAHVAGYFQGTIDVGDGVDRTSLTSTDLFLVRYAASGGEVRWARTYLGVEAMSLAPAFGGGVAMAGELRLETSLGSGTLTPSTWYDPDLVLAAWDGDGAPAGSIRYGETGSDYAYALGAGHDGYLLCGELGSTIDLGSGALTGVSSAGFVASVGETPWLGGGTVVPRPADPPPAFTVPAAARYGSSSVEGGDGLARGGSGALIFTGRVDGTIDLGGGPIAAGGGIESFIAKLDAGGAHQWSRRLAVRVGFVHFVYSTKPAANATDELAVTGTFRGTVDLGGGDLSSASDAVFLVRLDETGGHRWSRALIPTSGQIWPQAIHLDAGGTVLLHVLLRGTIDFGAGPVASADDLPIILAYDGPTGPPLWWRSYPGARSLATALDDDDTLVVAASFYQSIDLGGGPFSAPSYAVAGARYDGASGDVIWSRPIAEGAFDVYGASARNGRIALSGSAANGGGLIGDDLLLGGTGVGFVAALDAAGLPLWAHRLFGGYLGVSRPVVSLAGDGALWAAATFGPRGWFGTEVFTSDGEADPFLARFSADGTPLGSVAFGPLGSNGAYVAAVQATDSGAWITGLFRGAMTLGSTPLTSAGDYDAYLGLFAP